MSTDTSTQVMAFHVFVGEYLNDDRRSGFRFDVIATRATVETIAAERLADISARVGYTGDRRIEKIRKAGHRVIVKAA